MHSFWGSMEILFMDVEGLSKSFGKFGQHSCSWTKQHIHFEEAWKCQMDVGYQGTYTRFMFLNQTMQSLSTCVHMWKGCCKTIKEPWRTLKF